MVAGEEAGGGKVVDVDDVVEAGVVSVVAVVRAVGLVDRGELGA